MYNVVEGAGPTDAELFQFAVAHGWRPPEGQELTEEERDRPTIPAPGGAS